MKPSRMIFPISRRFDRERFALYDHDAEEEQGGKEEPDDREGERVKIGQSELDEGKVHAPGDGDEYEAKIEHGSVIP